MGARNMQGMRLSCNHCGYAWLYGGNSHVTSCPRCGWRVRISATPTPYLSRHPTSPQNQRREIHI